ncbi:MAG: YciI family protein [Nocardioides sp.]
MAQYLIYFNQQWVGDHPDEWFGTRVEPSMAVVRDMQAAGVLVFAGGLEEDGPVYAADATSGEIVVTDGPYVEHTEFLGGQTVIEVPDDETAKYWAGRVAEGCGWPQELRKFAPIPGS